MAITPDAPHDSAAEAPPAPPCGVDDPRIFTFGLLLEAHSALTRQLDADLQDSVGISCRPSRCCCASHARSGTDDHVGAGQRVSLTTGGVTRLADRLEKDGPGAAGVVPERPAVVWLALTDQGREMLTEALGHHLDSLERRVSSRISPRDTAVLNRVLDTLRRPVD